MNLFKSLFFAKYKSDAVHHFGNEWVDLSMEREHGHFSVMALPNDNAKGVVILAHPMKDLGKYFFVEYGHAQLYHELGYHIVLFDFNGFGQSADHGFQFQQDLDVVLTLTQEYFSNLPIGMHGVSFGGSQIILTAIERESELSGLLIESAVSSNLDYYKGRAKNLYHVLNLYNALFPKRNEHNLFYNQIQKIKNLPLLFVYGTQDVKTPLWMGESLYKNAKTPHKQLEVFDSRHLTTIEEEPARYRTMVASFWRDLL